MTNYHCFSIDLGRKYGKKNITTEEEDELDDSTMLEGASFIDNSFLHTIDSGNKKYVEGRKMVHDRVKPSIGTVKRGIKHKLYSSDEEDHNLQGNYCIMTVYILI